MLYTSEPYYEIELYPLDNIKLYFDKDDFTPLFDFYNYFYEHPFPKYKKKSFKVPILTAAEAATKCQLALTYLQEENIHEAITLLLSAAKNGNVTAQKEIGKIYIERALVPRDKKKGSSWLEKAAAKDMEAVIYLKKLYCKFIYDDSLIVDQTSLLETKRMHTWAEKLALSGDTEAMFLLAYYADDDDKADYWLDKAVEYGDSDAIEFLYDIGYRNKKRNEELNKKLKVERDERKKEAFSALYKSFPLEKDCLQKWLDEYVNELYIFSPFPTKYLYSIDVYFDYYPNFTELYKAIQSFFVYHPTIYRALTNEFEVIVQNDSLLEAYYERIQNHYKFIFSIGDKLSLYSMPENNIFVCEIALSDSETIYLQLKKDDFEDFFNFYNKVFHYYKTFKERIHKKDEPVKVSKVTVPVYNNDEDEVPF